MSAAIMLQTSCAPLHRSEVPAKLADCWAVGRPDDAGFNIVALDQLTQKIKNGEFPNTHAVLIEHDNRLVYEEYFEGTDEKLGTPLGHRVFDRDSVHDVRSITKSITSTLLGIALGSQPETALTNSIAAYFPNLHFRPEYQRITLHHVLTMTAGLEWNEMEIPYTDKNNDEIRMSNARDPFRFVLSRSIRQTPGTVWYYNGGLSQLLAGVVMQITGKSLDVYAKESLFDPLGIRHFEWVSSPTWKPEMPYAASGLRLRARDLAKFGSLFLHQGRWNGKQVVPSTWISLATARHVPEIDKRWSGGGVWGYGYQWWHGRFSQGYTVLAAFGNGNQRVFILPEQKIAVTIFAGEYNKFEGHSERLLHEIMAARSAQTKRN